MRKTIDWRMGNLAFDHDGRRWCMVFDFRALSKIPGIMDGSPVPSDPAALRRLMGLALAKHHPEMTQEAAGALIDSIGLPDASRLVRDALQAAAGHPWPAFIREIMSRPLIETGGASASCVSAAHASGDELNGKPGGTSVKATSPPAAG